jgi:hypothetical protein
MHVNFVIYIYIYIKDDSGFLLQKNQLIIFELKEY